MRLKKLTALAFLVISLFAIFSFTSVSASALTKPVTPKNVDVVEGYKSAVISWNPSKYATGYKVVKYNYDEKKYEVVAYTAKTEISVKLDYLEICGFKIQAYNKKGSSVAYSSYSSLCKFATNPLKVSTVKSSQPKMNSVTLSWPKVSGATGYQVYYTKGASDKTYSFFKSTTNTSLTLNLSSDTYYTFKVRAYFKVQTGLYSYGKYSDTVVKVSTTPSQVKGVELYNGTLSWDKANFVTSYQVWLKQSNGSYKKIATTSATSVKVNVSKSSYIKVRAFNNTSGKITYGSFSSLVKDVGKATGLKATPGYKSATLSWNKLSGASGYGVYVYNNSTKKYDYLKSTTSTSITLTLGYVTEYKFIVKPYVKIGSSTCWGQASATVTVATNPMAAREVKVSNIELESAKISWNKVSGATGYVLYYRKDATGSFTRALLTTSTSATIKLTANTSYEVVVRAYTKSPSGLYSYAKYTSSNVKFKTALSKVSGVKLASTADETANRKISYSAVDSARGYQVWAAKSGSSVYSFVGVSTSTTFTGEFPQNTYASVKVRAYYKLANGSYIYGAFSNTIKVQVGMNPVKGFKVNTGSTTSRTVALTWEPSNNVTGYRVYINKDGSWIGTNIPSSKTSYSYIGLKGYTSYDFAIRAYYTDSNNKKIYSDSIRISGKTKKATTTKLTVPANVTTYIGQTYNFKPQFTPSDTYNKSFTVTAKDFTFKYGGHKLFGVWYDQKTATLKWEDYFSINKDGSIIPKQETLIPEKYGDQKPFTFEITIIANDTKVKTTTQLSIDKVKMSIADKTTAYVGRPFEFSPTFTPSNVGSGKFTITPQNYVYKYGSLFNQRETILNWQDYFIIKDDGTISPIQRTITPAIINGEQYDQEPFSFKVVLYSAETKTSVTTNLSITTDPMKISYEVSKSWTYGETLNFYYDLQRLKEDNTAYTLSEIKWKSSDTSIATIDAKGKATFKGVGDVTFTVYTSDGKYSASVKNYVVPKIAFESNYFENCVAGESYQINASVLPTGAKATVSFRSTDTKIATVNSNGLVSFLKDGTVTIAVTSSEDSTVRYVVFTSDEYAIPTGDKAELYEIAYDYANEIKYYKPAFERVDHSEFSSINIESPSNEFEVESIFSSFEPTKSTFVSSNAEGYENSLPVMGQSVLIIPEGNLNFIKSVDVIDNGYTFDMKITLEDESMQYLQTNAQLISTSHGKIFDLLSKDYMDAMVAKFAEQKVEVTYGSFVQKYHDSSITITVNRVSGKVVNIEYDLVGDMQIDSARMRYIISSISKKELFNTDMDFTVNNIVNIKIFDYEK